MPKLASEGDETVEEAGSSTVSGPMVTVTEPAMKSESSGEASAF
jgi:hypothetical protein